jgi:hypothetical protein
MPTDLAFRAPSLVAMPTDLAFRAPSLVAMPTSLAFRALSLVVVPTGLIASNRRLRKISDWFKFMLIDVKRGRVFGTIGFTDVSVVKLCICR